MSGHEVTPIDVQRDMGALMTRLYPRPDIVFNALHGDGQVTSVRAGLAAVSPVSDAVMMCLADQPLLGAEDYRRLIAAFAALPPGLIAVPTVDGERGNPDR